MILKLLSTSLMRMQMNDDADSQKKKKKKSSGFNITKGKSWKNLGKQTGSGTEDFFTGEGGGVSAEQVAVTGGLAVVAPVAMVPALAYGEDPTTVDGNVDAFKRLGGDIEKGAKITGDGIVMAAETVWDEMKGWDPMFWLMVLGGVYVASSALSGLKGRSTVNVNTK
jgi:hypothetical protein